MPTKRKRGQSWEFIIKRAKLLPRPYTFTVDDEREGDARAAIYEAMLNRGVVPPEMLEAKAERRSLTIAEAISEYLVSSADPAPDDVDLLGLIKEKIGSRRVATCDEPWREEWIKSLKARRLAPGTIRHYVGALARCFDWTMGQHKTLMAKNPLRGLPKRYSQYPRKEKGAPKDIERTRRVGPDEEVAIRRILAGEKPEGRQRAFTLEHQDALNLLFEFAIETAMRLREMYTLRVEQVDLEKETIFLWKTKNGDPRDVPMTDTAIEAVKRYLAERHLKKTDLLFPWWDGTDDDDVLDEITADLSAQFGRIFDAAGCPDLTFHDLRHEATSRFFECYPDLTAFDIAKITGHKTIRMLHRYANLRGSTLRTKLRNKIKPR